MQHIRRVCGFVSLATGGNGVCTWGCVYMPPVAVVEEKQHWAALTEDVLAFQEKGPFHTRWACMMD